MACIQLPVTVGFCVPGALDLKPDEFQAAFASGVVGALTASQQVIPTWSSRRRHHMHLCKAHAALQASST